MNERAQEALQTLLDGNERYRSARNLHRQYQDHHRAALVGKVVPFAAVIACVDSRVVPEVIFDQPLGSMFVSRVPANVADDSAKWMIELAVGEFQVPVVIALGHTGCLAVKQILDGKSGPGGLLRFKVQSSVSRAQLKRPADIYAETIRQNAIQTIENLKDESWTFRDALRLGTTTAFAGVYDMSSGAVELAEQT